MGACRDSKDSLKVRAATVCSQIGVPNEYLAFGNIVQLILVVPKAKCLGVGATRRSNAKFVKVNKIIGMEGGH